MDIKSHTAPKISHNTVTSKDGTTIHYTTLGTGPSLVIVPGALAMAKDFQGLALEFARSFTVHVIERRGRGLSGVQGDNYGIDKERDDIMAVLEKTKAQYIFGHSFGGFITLETAKNNTGIKKIAVYEPGVSIDNSVSADWAPLAKKQHEQGKHLDAFITFVQGMNPDTTGKAPRLLLKAILPIAINKKERQQKYALLPGTIREHAEANKLNNTHHSYKDITAPVLLLAGSKSSKDTGAGYATKQLQNVIPSSKIITMKGLDHFGPEKNPRNIADEATRFFLSGK